MKKTIKVSSSPVTDHLFECYQEKVKCAATVRSTEGCKTLRNIRMESKRQWGLKALRSFSAFFFCMDLPPSTNQGCWDGIGCNWPGEKYTKEKADEAHHWGLKQSFWGKRAYCWVTESQGMLSIQEAVRENLRFVPEICGRAPLGRKCVWKPSSSASAPKHAVGETSKGSWKPLCTQNSDLIAIMDTERDDSHNQNTTTEGYKLFRRHRQGTRSRAVALYVEEQINCEELPLRNRDRLRACGLELGMVPIKNSCWSGSTTGSLIKGSL